MKETTIAQNADIHRQTAAEIFGFDPGAVTSSQRVVARAINFGLIYGNKDPESMIARYRAMDSDMPALRTAHAAYQRFSETADDPDPMIQFERRMLRQQWVDLVRLSVRSPVIAAALAGFEDAGVRAKYTQVAKHMVQDGE